MSKSLKSVSHACCIFQQPWWLDAVQPGRWNTITIKEGGNVIAYLPYCLTKKMGLRLLMMPPLTNTLGPWLAELPGKYSTRLSRQKKLMNDLIDELPPHDYFKHNFHYSITNWLPFYWNGFQQTTRYTYVIEDLSDLDKVWNNFEGSTRREIRKAEKELAIIRDSDPSLMWKLHTKTLERKNESPFADQKMFNRLAETCHAHDAGRFFSARDHNGNIHAAIFLVWDEQSAFYLMGGANQAYRNSGAHSLLMWEAIQFASERTSAFDFEGSMIEPIERFFRGFGARQKPYFQVTGMSKKMRFLMNSKEALYSLWTS